MYIYTHLNCIRNVVYIYMVTPPHYLLFTPRPPPPQFCFIFFLKKKTLDIIIYSDLLPEVVVFSLMNPYIHN